MTEIKDVDQGTQRVPVRSLWPHEAYDFTRWLAENLDLLGGEIGLSLEWVNTEEPVGPFFLDILAKEAATGRSVAIENQLKWTNTHHLGQLLTYATGCEARVAIWVATEFQHEHAEALYRLNEWTVSGIDFYGVRVETVRRTADSQPEPRFRKVVWPGGWNKDITLRSDPPRGMEHKAFFRPLIAELEKRRFSDQPPFKRWGHQSRFFRSPVNQGISYIAALDRTARVGLHIETGDKDLTKFVFDALVNDQQHLEARTVADPAPRWDWRRHDRWNYSSILLFRDGKIDDSPGKLEESRQWMLQLLHQLRCAFDPPIEKILCQHQSQPTNDG
ncbi:MAG: hypothetical protein OXF41_19810 [bacterium]|nr:hypothetical protein [bacterium]